MSFTSYIFDVLTDSIYSARLTIEEGIFKKIVPLSSESISDLDIDGFEFYKLKKKGD